MIDLYLTWLIVEKVIGLALFLGVFGWFVYMVVTNKF